MKADLQRIVFTSDLHGSTLCFRKAMSAAIEAKATALIIGGDISGKTMTPVIRRAGGKYEAWFAERVEHAVTATELNDLETAISDSGSYPLRVTEDEHLHLETNHELRQTRFKESMEGRLAQWLDEAERTLKPKGVRLLIICGNDDLPGLDDVIAASTFAENPERKPAILGDREVIGESSANKTPFHCPRDRTEEEIESRIRANLARLRQPDRAIFVFHIPPSGSTIDNVVELDEHLRPKTAAGSPILKPVGSTAVRKIIEEERPLLALHGHIHESPGFAWLGKTLCCNPGSEYTNGIMRSVLVTFDQEKVRGYMFLTR
jgi:Icc-related predicted phosphoesterase